MSPYNGWSPERRARMSAIARLARAEGRLAYAGPCELCGRQDHTAGHAEEYGPTEADYFANIHSVCCACHAMIHSRFRFAATWSRYVEKLAAGWRPALFRNLREAFFACQTGLVLNGGSQHGPTAGPRWWEALTTERYSGPMKG